MLTWRLNLIDLVSGDVSSADKASAAGFTDDDVTERAPSANQTPPGDADVTRPRPDQTAAQSRGPCGGQTSPEIRFRHFRSQHQI